MVTSTTIRVCDKHGPVKWDLCERCLAEKCEHGVPAAGHCDQCNADTSWQTAPISDEELEDITRLYASRAWGELGFRTSGRPRDYTAASRMGILLAEFKKLRAQVTP